MTETAAKSKWEWETERGSIRDNGGGFVGVGVDVGHSDDICRRHNAAVRELEAEIERLREALASVLEYGSVISGAFVVDYTQPGAQEKARETVKAAQAVLEEASR